jgi:hypothetical protein
MPQCPGPLGILRSAHFSRYDHVYRQLTMLASDRQDTVPPAIRRPARGERLHLAHLISGTGDSAMGRTTLPMSGARQSWRRVTPGLPEGISALRGVSSSTARGRLAHGATRRGRRRLPPLAERAHPGGEVTGPFGMKILISPDGPVVTTRRPGLPDGERGKLRSRPGSRRRPTRQPEVTPGPARPGGRGHR